MWYAVDNGNTSYVYCDRPAWREEVHVFASEDYWKIEGNPLGLKPGQCVKLGAIGEVESHIKDEPVKWTEIGSTSVAVVDGKTLTVLGRSGTYIHCVNGLTCGYSVSRDEAKMCCETSVCS